LSFISSECVPYRDDWISGRYRRVHTRRYCTRPFQGRKALLVIGLALNLAPMGHRRRRGTDLRARRERGL